MRSIRGPLEGLAAEALEPGGGVPDLQAQNEPGVHRSPGAQGLPRPAPPRVGAPSLHPAGPDGHVIGRHFGQQAGDVLRLVGEVGVHLHHILRPHGDGAGEASHVCGPQPHLARATRHPHSAAVLGRQPLRQVRRAVRRVVVHQQDLQVRDADAHEAPQELRQVPRLVVCGYDNDGLPERELGRWAWGRRPSRRPPVRGLLERVGRTGATLWSPLRFGRRTLSPGLS